MLFFLGLFIGSFLNVLIDRLPAGESVLWGRSHCDHCKAPLRWFELIPLLSWIFQRGKCRRCHARLSFEYPLVEMVTGALFLLVGLAYEGDPVRSTVSLVIFSALFVITAVDLKFQIIPDSMVVVLIVMAVVSHVLGLFPGVSILNRMLSGGLASLFFFVLWVLTKGKGMGFGDVKLAIPMGLLLGSPGIIFALYIAFLTGAGSGVILILLREKTLKSRVAFGPFLVIGTSVMLIWGDRIAKLAKGVLW